MSKPKLDKGKPPQKSPNSLASKRTLVITMSNINPAKLGIGLEEIEQRLEVINIKRGSEGSKYFQVGDILLTLNGTKVDTKPKLKQCMERAVKEERSLEFKVARATPSTTVDQQDIKAPRRVKSLGTVTKSDYHPVVFIGVTIENNNTKQPGIEVCMLPIKSDLVCLEVCNINENSPFVGRLKSGDWIMSVNGEATTDEKSFKKQLKNNAQLIMTVGRRRTAAILGTQELTELLAAYGSSPPKKKSTRRQVKIIAHDQPPLIVEAVHPTDPDAGPEPSFIDLPTEIRDVQGEEKQKEILKWRQDNLDTDNVNAQDMKETLEVALKQLENDFQEPIT